jgi:ribosomal protein S18 acetylase RimI-like enzyme
MFDIAIMVADACPPFVWRDSSLLQNHLSNKFMPDITNEFNKVTIRRAALNDMEPLLSICRYSFLDSIRWQGPRFLATRWLTVAIVSRSSEIWVCSKDSKIAGFCIIITDQGLWRIERPKRDGPMLTRLLASATCPTIVFRKIYNRIANFLNRSYNSPPDQHNPRQKHSGAGKSIWIELIAVSDAMRRQGLAKYMLRFCESYAKELKRSVIRLSVDSTNKAARNLYERTGFICTAQTPVSCIYTKMLSEQDQTEHKVP